MIPPSPCPLGDDAANYLIHDFELRDVASLLWLAGAEAVAINDERLVASTSIYCVGSTIIVNNTRLSPPYEIRALGNLCPTGGGVEGSRYPEEDQVAVSACTASNSSTPSPRS